MNDVKKVDKVPDNEIARAVKIKEKYFDNKQKNKEMTTTENISYSLAEMKDKYIGKTGTTERDEYEYELSMDVLGRMIKTAR